MSYFIFVGVYCIIILLLWYGWTRTTISKPANNALKEHFISVIIPVRNEENHIYKLLSDIEGQDYPKNKFEVIIVNDNSEDDTVRLVNKFIENTLLDIYLHDLPEHVKAPKKDAITYGIKQSRGEIVLNTDGDTGIGPHWIKEINRAYQDETTALVFGPVTLSGKGWFHNMQIMEFAALVAGGAASLKYHIPSMCNGANISYRKNLFFEVNGFQDNRNTPSGDDEFLMHKIFEKFPRGVRFLRNKNVIVETNSKRNINSFISQRKRWASKWKYYKNKNTKLLAFLIYALNLTWLIFLMLTVLNKINVAYFLQGILLKFLIDFLYINDAMKFLNKRINFLSFILLELIHPFYVVATGLAGSFGRYNWKGRKY